MNINTSFVIVITAIVTIVIAIFAGTSGATSASNIAVPRAGARTVFITTGSNQ